MLRPGLFLRPFLIFSTSGYICVQSSQPAAGNQWLETSLTLQQHGPSVSERFPFLVVQFLGLCYPQPPRSYVLLLANHQALFWNLLSEVEPAWLRVKNALHHHTPSRKLPLSNPSVEGESKKPVVRIFVQASVGTKRMP